MTNLPDGFEWAENVPLGNPEVYSLSQAAWPRFLLDESDRPDPILKFQMTAQDFKERFKAFGIKRVDDRGEKLVAFLQAVHVEADISKPLPELGWRFSIQNASQRSVKNALSLVEASIADDARGFGLSKHLIERAKQEAREYKFMSVIAPVRPTHKTQFPLETIETYLARKTSDGKPFDPWIRTHLDAGAKLSNVCHHSVCVTATLPWWRERTGLELKTDGDYTIDGGLMPLRVAGELGVYTEPNVWMTYEINA